MAPQVTIDLDEYNSLLQTRDKRFKILNDYLDAKAHGVFFEWKDYEESHTMRAGGQTYVFAFTIKMEEEKAIIQ